MNKFWKIFGVLFATLYLCFTAVAVWKLYNTDMNDYPHEKVFVKSNDQKFPFYNINQKQNFVSFSNISHVHKHKIEVWGKAAIGMYFWIHIMNGKLESSHDASSLLGNVTLEDIVYYFHTGPGIIQSTVPMDAENIILILNGRTQKKIAAATAWLDYLPAYGKLQKLAVILLGNEECDNTWILPYMRSRGGAIDVVFLVYDSPIIDNDEFYQWPLGVAVYRGFPNILPNEVDINSKRPYVCNFLGTVYKNSSRVTLTQMVKSSAYQKLCIIKEREKWLPLETEETFSTYIHSLSNSDLTLSPVGKNTECYRIYEAMSLGSIPVVEDVITPGFCDVFPLRLLKQYRAPIIYLKNWRDLPDMLKRYSELPFNEKVKRRRNVVEWYIQFKQNLRDKFHAVIHDKFFGG